MYHQIYQIILLCLRVVSLVFYSLMSWFHWLVSKIGLVIKENISASDGEDNKRVQKIVDKVQLAMKTLENSSFFRDFMQQMRHPELVTQIERVIGTDPQHLQLQLVFYGLGELDPDILAFAILLRDRFQWVSDIVVYDRCVSPVQQKVSNTFNCTFLSVDELSEYGKLTVERPTLFFIPHCQTALVDNVLLSNWTSGNLNKIIILSDSFNVIKKDKSDDLLALKHLQAILHTDNILHEMPLPDPETYEPLPDPETCESSGLYPDSLLVFFEFSWHFFTLEDGLNLDLLPDQVTVT